MRAGKGIVVLSGVLLGVGILVWHAFRDIALDVDLLRENFQKIPAVILENLEFEREISGDLWQVRVPLAERRDGRIEIRSADVSRRMQNGREWYFRSAAGFYSEAAESVDLIALLGTLETDSRVLNLESPYLSWTRSEGGFFFPKGLLIYDNEFLLTADAASIDEDGIILLDKGGVLKWTRDSGSEAQDLIHEARNLILETQSAILEAPDSAP